MTDPSSSTSPFDRRALVACGAAALLAGLVYLNALHTPFVYDDYHTVVENASLQNLANVRAIVLYNVTRPIVNFSYAIDRALWGTEPLGFHVTNVLLHMLNVILLFQLAWRLVANRRGRDDTEQAARVHTELVAFSTAALFAVHPMMSEAVGYISGRSEVLCATFFLLGLLCGRRWVRGDGAKWAILTVVLWVAALATKETAAMFPFVFFCYDWCVGHRSIAGLNASRGSTGEKRRRLLTVHLPLIAAALVAGVVRLAVLARVEYPGQVAVHWSYLLLAMDVGRRYAGLILFPAGQTIFHEVASVRGLFDPRALIALGSVGLMVGLAWKLRRAEGLASFGILWFLLLLVPSSTLMTLDQGEPMAEHRVYLASGGLFLAAGIAIGWLAARLDRVNSRLRLLPRAALALVLLSFCMLTLSRNVVWADPVTLWRESVDLAPHHYRPRLLLGEALQDAGRHQEAVEQFATAIRLRPTEPTGYVKLGQCLAEVGLAREARLYFLKAIEIEPRNASARQSLGILDRMESRLGPDVDRR